MYVCINIHIYIYIYIIYIDIHIYGNPEVESVLQHPCHPDCNGGVTALMKASDSGHVEVVRVLLEASAHVDFAGYTDLTSLMLASCRGHAEVVRLLLEAGAHIDLVRQ